MISLKPQFEADSRSKRMIPALGTFVRLELNLQGEEFLFLSNEVFNEIKRVEKKFSFFDPTSEISKLNKTEAGVGVS